MKIAPLCILAMSLSGLLLACSSDSTTGSASGSCKQAAGTYKMHFVKDPSSTGTCADIPDSTVTVKEDTGDGGTGSSAPGCTTTTDKSSCSSTTKCTQTTSGITSESTITGKLNSDSSVSGTSETKISGNPAVNSNCKYSFTQTKQ